MRLKEFRRHGAALAVVAGVSIALTACAGGASPNTDDPSGEIIVGVGVPLTGGSSVLGEPMSHGIEMAVKEINEAGGINGRTITLLEEDTGPDDTTALNAFNRLASNNPVAVIGYPVSTQGFAIMTQIDRTGIPVLVGGTNSRLAGGSDLAFNMTAHDGVATVAAVDFAVQELGVTKLALLRESGELGTGGSEIVRATAEANGVEVVAEEIFQTGDVDLSVQANNLRNSDAEIIFIFGQQADFITASNALATASVGLDAFASGLQPGTFAEMNLDGLGTVYVRNQCVPATATSGALFDWSQEYEAAFGKAPTEYAAIAYDGMMMLADAIESGGADPAAVAEALKATPEHEGICGMHRAGPDGNLSFSVTLGHYDADRNYVMDKSMYVAE